MTDPRVELRASRPAGTVLDAEPMDAREALEEARRAAPGDQRGEISTVVARWPAYLEAWAELGDRARDPVEAYACYRVAYHRGLDRLRKAGWSGSGYVRWEHPENRGFLRALAGLAMTANLLGEAHEAQRCEQFLLQLEPTWNEIGPGA